MLACSERIRPVPARHARPDEPVSEHAALAASFVSNDSASLRRLLHPDLVVQPPEPGREPPRSSTCFPWRPIPR
ncbi:MAG TPA: hypothetical protein VD930_00770 [Gemmatimonadales bacterium]|nr:hypothetical protein [Gemmatimonadales bacterium]